MIGFNEHLPNNKGSILYTYTNTRFTQKGAAAAVPLLVLHTHQKSIPRYLGKANQNNI